MIFECLQLLSHLLGDPHSQPSMPQAAGPSMAPTFSKLGLSQASWASPTMSRGREWLSTVGSLGVSRPTECDTVGPLAGTLPAFPAALAVTGRLSRFVFNISHDAMVASVPQGLKLPCPALRAATISSVPGRGPGDGRQGDTGCQWRKGYTRG